MLIKYEDKDGQSREMIVTGYGVLKKRREGLSIETNLMESAKKVDQVPREKVEK